MRAKILALALLAGPVAAGPVFTPVPAPPHVYSGGWEHFVGGGLAGFDCDGDALPELFAAGGSAPAQLLRNHSTARQVAFQADTPPALALTGVTGAYPIDIDSDGRLDLVILRVGPNQMLRGGPDCSFAPFPELRLPAADRWTTAFSATWEAGQTLPTLAFGNYVDRNNPDGPFRACDRNDLLRPNGMTYDAPRPLTPGYCPLSMLFSDWGRRGRADLRLSNDRHYYVTGGQEQMWAMEATPRLLTARDGWADHQLWGMGIATRDLDFDGRPEVMLSSMGDQRLQRLVGDGPGFADVPYERGTTAHRPYTGGDGRPSTGWHISFGDVQNDGLSDIFIAKGNVDQMPGSAMHDPNNLLIARPDGTFSEAGKSAGIASPHRGRGAVLMDFNGDGRLDLAVNNRRAPLEIWQNTTPGTGHWLAVATAQPGPNRNAIGAWIELDDGNVIRLRERTLGGGHAGGVSGPEHFGLGTATQVRVRVTWPDGATSDWTETGVDRTITVTRSAK